MKAVLQNVKTGVVSIEEIPQPILKPGNVLVRNVCSLVSAGTEKAVLDFSKSNYLQKARKRPDLVRKVLNRAKNEGLWQTYKIVSNLIDQPIALGYSCAGTVIEVGAEVGDISPGQRVACAGLFVATHAEVVSVPRNLVVAIPDGVAFDEASFVTLGAIAMQGVRLASLELGESVLVYGLGLVGMVAAQLASAAGCRVFGVDIDPAKLDMVTRMGCTAVPLDDSTERALLQATRGYGVDKVLLCAATKSNDPIERIPAMTRQKGVVVVVGDVSMNIPRRDYYEKEIDIRLSRSYGPGRYDPTYEEGGTDYPFAYVRWTENRNMVAVLDLAAQRKIDLAALVSHRYEIANALKAYDLIEGKSGEKYLGVVIDYPAAGTAGKTAQLRPQAAARTASNNDISLGVIGAGNFAKAFLLPAFKARPGVRFDAICTASGVSSFSVAQKYRASKTTSNPDEIFNDPAIDAVLVATRHDSHARYVQKAIESGKAIFVEKPMATTMQDLDAIREAYLASEAAGRKPLLMVGFNRRFSPLSLAVHNLVRQRGEPLSMVYRVNAGFVAGTEWVQDPTQGGGRIIGEVCHFIDLMTYFCGSLPTEVFALPMLRSGRAVDDIASITVRFADGSIGTVHYFANGDPSLPKEYVEVFVGGLAIQLSNFRSVSVHGGRLGARSRYLNQVKGFNEEATAFVDALRAGGPPPISFAELYAVSRATLAAVESMHGGRPVQV